MITFKNIAGNKFLAVGTIQRKSALNGEKSLTGTLYDSKDVLNKIDKGWSLEFGGEPYVVTYFERNDNDNSVSFDAIHKFFWDMAKKVLYSITEISGSHTITWYLDQIFANTGYTYALNFSPAAIEKDNWGNKTRLSLFNDLITSIAGEFEINGTLISIFQNIGTDLSTIVRYGFNLSDMTLENDATNFVTYGEGFGAYADQENQTGDRVHVTYTSPLAGVYGILQAEPIDDQRYTSQTNLRAAVKSQVDASFSVSVQLSLYDLTAAGYPYKMANVGDWLTAVDENLDFKQRIRIISIDDEFSADGTRISYTVTAGDVGLTKKYQDANASMASQVANAIVSAGQASTDANFALIAANGKLTAYYVGSYDKLPTTANEGDLGWVTSGDGRLLYIYTKKADGSYYWEKRIDPEMGDQIAAGVTDAVTQANAHSDKLVADNVAQVNTVLDDVQAKQTELTAQQAELDTKAQGYADKALADAKADTLATATQTAKDASDALATAKTDLTTSLNKEVTDRANAVTALDTKAKGYADTAKTDAINAATTADGVINKKIDDTASSITSTISQNKTDTDGKITTAQSTATQALNGLATKVSQTVYDAKTGQLQTDLNTTTTTANQAKTDIVAIKSDNTKQDARMTTIESDANGTKTTVSNLQTDLGKANGSITTLQQRADGFDATVTKVNNLSTGGRNYILASKVSSTTMNTSFRNSSTLDTFSGKFLVVSAQVDYDNITALPTTDWRHRIGVEFVLPLAGGGNVNVGAWKSPAIGDSFHGRIYQVFDFTSKVFTGTMGGGIYVQNITGTNVVVSNPKLEIGTIPTDFSVAPEDVDSATARAQLTADQATTSLNTYKTDADGRISKAQADIIVNANAITQKVSQSDYNAKTGDLTTKVNTAQSTADSATSTIGSYKTANDARVASAESKITANATAITQKVSQTDYNTKTGQIDGQISTINQTATGISQSVSNVQAQVNSLSVGGRNLYITSTQVQGYINGSNGTVAPQNSNNKEMASGYIAVLPNTQYIFQAWGSLLSGQQYWAGIGQYDANKVFLNRTQGVYSAQTVTTNVPNDYEKTTFTTGANTYFVRVSSRTFGNYKIKFEQGNMPTDWSPAPEDTDNKISTVSQTVDSISSIVSDPTTGLTKRVQTAEGSISTVQSNVSDLQSKQTQTANGLTTEISNRATGDTNTLTQAKDFTTSSISNSESGMKSLITQTSDSIIAKVDTKTDSATVLSLLKDNWSIGITGNTNKLASGIAADPSAMDIVSQKVIIDSPQTQITGTAWINSAMIGNGAIGTAQIGDASITSAKIMNMDVNKITGNVSNWVLSQWTSATGSKVTIDGNGLYFSPGTSRMTADGFESWRFEEGHYAAMGLLGSYNWVSNSDMNGIGLIAKYYDRAHTSAGDPYRNEIWGADTIAIGGLQPEVGNGYGYIDPFMIFPANATIGERYFPGNGDDTIIMSRRLSIYTGLNMHGTAITNSSGYSLKENFKPISGTDALDIFDNTDIVSYDYIPLTDDIDEQATAERKNKVGFVINDNGQSPYKTDSRLIRYGNTRDDSVTVGYLMAAVKELHTKVKELETQLGK